MSAHDRLNIDKSQYPITAAFWRHCWWTSWRQSWRQNWGVVLIAGCLPLASFSSVAQSLPDDSRAALWRASSRLGYGPSAALARQAPASAKAWALQQLDDAAQSSQRPPQIAQPLALIGLSANEATAKFHEEREARRLGRSDAPTVATAVMAGTATVATTASTTILMAPAVTVQATMPVATSSIAPLGKERENFSRDMQQGIAAWRLAACSNPEVENPMLARMTEFWFNHFNVYVAKGTVRPFVASYIFQAIRPHALGKFEDLLLATAQHPAMLQYLDQAQSKAKGLNENYAREIMELHTLGVNGGYTQTDVRELARVLTGWGMNIPAGQAFAFARQAHDADEKIVMGQRYAANGDKAGFKNNPQNRQQQGVDAIRFLARQPATAQRIAQRLATFFIADQPPPAVVERLAKSFQSSGGDIKVVMRSLIESPEFWEQGNTLFKTPLDYACSALMASGRAQEGSIAAPMIRLTLNFLSQTGQGLHEWQTPDGYKTDAMTWLAPESLTRRADYAFGLATRNDEPTYLQPFYSAATWQRVAQDSSALTRTGLLLSAPEFMMK